MLYIGRSDFLLKWKRYAQSSASSSNNPYENLENEVYEDEEGGRRLSFEDRMLYTNRDTKRFHKKNKPSPPHPHESPSHTPSPLLPPRPHVPYPYFLPPKQNQGYKEQIYAVTLRAEWISLRDKIAKKDSEVKALTMQVKNVDLGWRDLINKILDINFELSINAKQMVVENIGLNGLLKQDHNFHGHLKDIVDKTKQAVNGYDI